ncbi:hypothetical protein Hanom_Chr05g00401951 [Helianthus anomalus]
MIGKIAKPDYVAPKNDHWWHEDSNSEDESERLSNMTENKLRFWFERDDKKRKRTPKISLKVSTPKVPLRVKIGKLESQERLVDHYVEYYSNIVDICVAGPTKKKSPPRLIDENVIPPADVIQEGVDLIKVTLENYLKKNEDAKANKVGEGADKGVKEKKVEGVGESDSSSTESDIDPTKIAPTSYVSGKQKLKRSPKKKKDSDEEVSTYVPTPKEKKKGLKKRKARRSGDLPRNVRSRKESTEAPEIHSAEAPKVESVEVPIVQSAPELEKVQNVEGEKNDEDVEVEFIGERQSTPPPPPEKSNNTYS